MPNSKVNADYNFDKKIWVASLVNSVGGTTGTLGGHAVIVVEGQNEDGTVFQGEYDITANSFPEEQDPIQSSLGNTMGYITKIRCNPTSVVRQQPNSATAEFHRDYEKLSTRSWYVLPEAALMMIRSIEQEAQIIDDEINGAVIEGRNINWPIRYQKAGSERWSIFGGNNGENCITWAEKKLAIAGAGNSKLLLDSVKAVPEKHIRCVIL